MRIALQIISLLISGQFLIGQTPASTSTRDGSSYDIATNSTLGLHNYDRSKPVSYDDIDGSPFYYDDYVHSTGITANGEVLDSLNLKYDLATYNFLLKSNDGDEEIIDTRKFREFHMNIEGEEILFKRVDPRYPDIFYEIIFQNKDMTIYKSEEVSMVKGEDLGISKTNDRFFTKETYLVKKGDQIEWVKLKKKSLWKYLSKEQTELLDHHLKTTKTKLRKTSDYRKLFKLLSNQVRP